MQDGQLDRKCCPVQGPWPFVRPSGPRGSLQKEQESRDPCRCQPIVCEATFSRAIPITSKGVDNRASNKACRSTKQSLSSWQHLPPRRSSADCFPASVHEQHREYLCPPPRSSHNSKGCSSTTSGAMHGECALSGKLVLLIYHCGYTCFPASPSVFMFCKQVHVECGSARMSPTCSLRPHFLRNQQPLAALRLL